MPVLTLQHQTMFRELLARCLDAGFDADFPENGSFSKKAVGGKSFWYYQGYAVGTDGPERAKRRFKYVGPVDDPEVTQRVSAFRALKSDYTERRRLVSSLRNAGLPSPLALSGDVIEALWKAGVFRLRGVLVGTAAFQTYAGLLGTTFPSAATTTDDIDIAQFHAVSLAVDDTTPSLEAVLQTVDPTFAAVPHRSDGRYTNRLTNKAGFKVEFLSPNTSSDAFMGKPTPLPALGGMSGEPLRFLDYLIFETAWSVLLHKGGIPVRVPAPARYAVHKIIVSAERRSIGAEEAPKIRKDAMQAAALIRAFDDQRQADEIGHAWIEAWDRGPRWQEALRIGVQRLPSEANEALERAIDVAAAALKRDGAAVRP